MSATSQDQYLYICGSEPIEEKLKIEQSINCLFRLVQNANTIFNKEKIIKIAGGISFFVFLTNYNNIYYSKPPSIELLKSFEELRKDFNEKVIDIACFSDEILVLSNYGNVYNLLGDLKQIKFTKNNNVSIKYIAQGDDSSFAISTEDKVFIWGSNMYYRLGVTQEEYIQDPIKLTVFEPPLQNEEKIIEIVTDTTFSFFITSFGKIYSCGDSQSLVMGHESTPIKVPTRIKSLENKFIISVKTGASTALLLTREHELFILGKNYLENGKSQKGLINITDKIINNELRIMNDYIESINCGNEHYTFLSKNGKILQAGNNDKYQLGIGEKNILVSSVCEGRGIVMDISPSGNCRYRWSIYGNYNSTILIANKEGKDLYFMKLKERVNGINIISDIAFSFV
ncbi:hypothetical protein ABK040_013415 [Willaertia magna]